MGSVASAESGVSAYDLESMSDGAESFHFSFIAKEALVYLKRLPSGAFPSEDFLSRFEQYLNELSVFQVPDLEGDNEFHYTAINFPDKWDKIIVVAEDDWREMGALDRWGVVLHEILPGLGYNDENYYLSGKILRQIWALRGEGSLAEKIVQTNMTCDDQELDDLATLLGGNTASLEDQEQFLEAALKTKCRKAIPLFKKFSSDPSSIKIKDISFLARVMEDLYWRLRGDPKGMYRYDDSLIFTREFLSAGYPLDGLYKFSRSDLEGRPTSLKQWLDTMPDEGQKRDLGELGVLK
ncbi:hypothetical protein AZI86_08970 [Bdellovibrio bacteriovorus]|uniref:Uncharacterized protein n=2 Tax=Bdellovibrio bacteriovorus TaxID=959 RepID=A0A150WRP2_BDEBC|nr:hypothetical protein AZI86_08970 [Bdellovibrio bacteriovorus]